MYIWTNVHYERTVMHIDFDKRPGLPSDIPQGALVYEPTELQSITFCGHKYYLEHICGYEKPYTSNALFQGIIGHQILREGIDFFDDIFYSGVNFYRDHKSPIRMTDEDIKKLYDEMKLQIINYTRMAERIGLVPVEKEITGFIPIEAPLYGTVSVNCFIVGTADLYATTRATLPGHIDILDYKFGRVPPIPQLNRNLQLGLYYLMARAKGYKVDTVYWVPMGDFLEYKKGSKKSNSTKGDLRGPGLRAIKITDEDTDTIIQQALCSIKAINVKAYMKHSNYASQPCNFCEFERVCSKFKVGILDPESEDW